MCRVSKISFDWMVKGFHLHVYGVELVMRPDHLGGVVFRKFFSTTSDAKAQPAIKRAEELLGDLSWRQYFFRELERGRAFMNGQIPIHGDLPRGRALEFTFLMAAIEKMGI